MVKKVNLNTKKTEEEWQKASDSFFLKATPKIYEWLGWVAILAVLIFAYNKTHSSLILAVLIVTSIFTYFYYIAYFCIFIFTGLPLIKNYKLATLISYILSSILGFCSWLIANNMATILSQHQV